MPLQGTSINVQGGVLYNMESLINKFTKKYICFYNLYEVRGFETKDNS